jgi:hypothetical protein
MNVQNLLNVGLVVHIIGMATIAGVTLASYVASRQFRKLYSQNKQTGVEILEVTRKFSMIAGIGLLLLILSGVVMLSATGGGYGQQLWFRIKMIFVISIMASGILLKMVLEKRLRARMLEDVAHGNRSEQVEILRSRISFVQLLLLSFFTIIFILSVFRFT